MKKLNERYHRFTRFVAFVIVLVSVIGFFWKGLEPLMAIYDKWKTGNIKYSHQDSILQEIYTARNTLDYILLQSQQQPPILTRTILYLEHRNYVEESFADNLTIKKNLIDLYRGLSSAQTSAKELMDLIIAKNPDPTTMQNRKADIKAAIDFADKIGPQVAKEIGGFWEVLPPNTPEKDRIKYHETKMRGSIATAPAEVRTK